MSAPAVTIGMSVRNGSETIVPAIRSLLWQTFPDWELVVIDDGSSDDSFDRIDELKDERFRIVRDGESRGLPARLNQAIDQARGRYFARMDADDIAYPDRLRAQLDHLERDESVDLLGTGSVVFDHHGDPLGRHAAPAEHERICANPLAGFRLSHPTWMGRTDWFRRYRYDESHLRAQDQDLLLRSWRTSRFGNLPSIHQGYREENLSLSKIWKGRGYWIRSLRRELGARGEVLPMARGISAQVLKGFVDLIAISTGLRYAVLRHRALALSPAEKAEWQRVYSMAVGMLVPSEQRKLENV